MRLCRLWLALTSTYCEERLKRGGRAQVRATRNHVELAAVSTEGQQDRPLLTAAVRRASFTGRSSFTTGFPDLPLTEES